MGSDLCSKDRILAQMDISIIVPAYNEERLITGCLQSIAAALTASRERGFEHEVIVVDTNSSDRTAELARQAGALVCFESVSEVF